MSFQRVGLGNQDQNYLLRYPTVLSCQPPYQLISSLQTASSSPIESERKKHAFLNLHAHFTIFPHSFETKQQPFSG
jgi:hypothetical protein